MTEPMCSKEGCAGKIHGKGLCGTHHRAYLRAQQPKRARPTITRTIPPCKYENCTQPSYLAGLCTQHHQDHRQKVSETRKANGSLANFYETMDYDDYWLWVKDQLKLA